MTKVKRSFLLMHPVRREIYKIVSESPGNYFFDIANELQLPHGTAFWHLKKLEDAGLVKSIKFAGKRLFFSTSLRGEEIEKAFVVLKSEATQHVFQYIVDNEGCYQAQISEALQNHHDTIRHHIQRLIDANLIRSEKKGRNVFYYISEIGTKILSSTTEIISQAYVDHLFEILEDECLYPEVIDKTHNKLTIRISCIGKDDVYFSLELKGWTMMEKTVEVDEEDDVLELDKPVIAEVEELSRPKIARIEDD